MVQDICIEASILPSHGFDHLAICLNIDLKTFPWNHPFQFKKLWLHLSKFLSNNHKWWEEIECIDQSTMFSLYNIMKHIKWQLKGWNKGHIGYILEEK